jgi:competence protein ComGF
MKKRKKKHNPFKEEKLHRAHLKNEFLPRLARVFREMTGKDLFKILPPQEQDLIFERRIQAYKVMPARGHKIPVMVLNSIKALINSWFKQLKVFIHQTGQEVAGRDFYSLYVTLVAFANDTKIEDYSNAAEFKKALEPYADIIDLYKSTNQKLSAIMFNITMLNSDFEGQVYSFVYEVRDYFHDRPGCFLILEIYGLSPERTQLDIEGTKRQAVRVGWVREDPKPRFDYVEIPAMDLPGTRENMEKLFPVYIQHHALQRLRERMDIHLHGLLYDSLYESLCDPAIYRSSNGALLIEYLYLGIKTGYLRAELHDDILLIHTFLFLTNNGTPEGEKLHMNTGLKKEDKMYLDIDKLSSFVVSDIKNNKAVKEIFVKSGCESLFLIDPNLVCEPGSEIREKPLAMRIANYLDIEIDDEFMQEIGEMEENQKQHDN